MKISGMKYYKDKSSFKTLEIFGLNVEEIEDVDKTDEKIKSLIDLNYKTIIITDELAGFSQDIIKKYNNQNEINIIIAKSKTKKEV